MNIAEQGWAYGPFRLVAHFPSPFSDDYWVVAFADSEDSGNIIFPVFLPDGEQTYGFIAPTQHGRFPYGFEVEPD